MGDVEKLNWWRKEFRKYVNSHGGMKLLDPSGADIDFDCGKPMWEEGSVLQECAGGMKLRLRQAGLVCEEDEKRLIKWIWGFAARMGVFHVETDLEVVHDNDADYTVEVTADLPDPQNEDLVVCADGDTFYIVGNPTNGVFAHFKGDEFGDGCYVDVTDPMKAERFDTYEQAVNALVEDEDLRIWMDEQTYGEDVKPLKVSTSVKVTTK